MLIFDEKRYAMKILSCKRFLTLQHNGMERRAVAKYLKYDKGATDEDIKDIVSEIKTGRSEYFSDDIWNELIQRMLEKYKEEEYIKDVKVSFSESEMKVILGQPSVELRNLLFVLAVYYKWAKNTNVGCDRASGFWVKESDIECCRIAGLGKLRKSDRVAMFKELCDQGVYVSDYIRRYNNIFNLSFLDDGKSVLVVDTYEEVLAHLEKYIDVNSCKECSVCGALFHKTNNKKHMCKVCSLSRKHKKG